MDEPDEAEWYWGAVKEIWLGELALKHRFVYVADKPWFVTFNSRSCRNEEAIVGPTGAENLINLHVSMMHRRSVLVVMIKTCLVRLSNSWYGACAWPLAKLVKENLAWHAEATDLRKQLSVKAANVDHPYLTLPGGYNMVNQPLTGKQLWPLCGALLILKSDLGRVSDLSSVDKLSSNLDSKAMKTLAEQALSLPTVYRLFKKQINSWSPRWLPNHRTATMNPFLVR